MSSHKSYYITGNHGLFESVSKEQFDMFLSNYDRVVAEPEFPDEFTEIINFFYPAGYRIAYTMFSEEFTDEELDLYAVEVLNGDGYYDCCGHFVRYPDPDLVWGDLS